MEANHVGITAFRPNIDRRSDKPWVFRDADWHVHRHVTLHPIKEVGVYAIVCEL
jgi:hypothetical protein